MIDRLKKVAAYKKEKRLIMFHVSLPLPLCFYAPFVRKLFQSKLCTLNIESFFYVFPNHYPISKGFLVPCLKVSFFRSTYSLLRFIQLEQSLETH